MDIIKLKERSKIIHLIRQWFDNQGFIEVHTPRLIGLPGQEPYLEPFWTHLRQDSGGQAEVIAEDPLEKEPALSERKVDASRTGGSRGFLAALITSPEYSMKKLLGAGMDKIYDLGPCFRNNEPWDGSHDPEFLMLEWYRRDSGLDELMNDTESMIHYVVDNSPPTPLLSLREGSFRRITVERAWREFAGVELAPLLGDREALAKIAVEKFSQTVNSDDDWDDIYFKVFLSQIEEKLGERPTFLYRYPVSQASLARKSVDDPRWADRVEFYMGDLELANGFAELSDPIEQRQRFVEEQNLRLSKDKQTWAIDEDFIEALPGMGNAAGIAFGVERLVMLLTDSKSINEILPFSARERFASRRNE